MGYELSLAGKVALVTGGARGIGRGIALEMARAGADVCAVDLGDAEAEGSRLVREIGDLGRKAIFAAADVSDRAAMEAVLARAGAELGPVDIAVANAIRSQRNDILETDFDQLKRTIEVGIYGVFHTFQLVARQLVARQAKGAFIYISSPHVPYPFKGSIDYNVAKTGSYSMAMSAANELMWHGIRVNILQPGWTDTPGERNFYTDEIIAREGQKMPLGRIGLPEDLGKAAVFLCSDKAEYITGAVVTVDGGQFIQGPAWNAKARHGE